VQAIFTKFEVFINNCFERKPQTLNNNICFYIVLLVLLEAGDKRERYVKINGLHYL